MSRALYLRILIPKPKCFFKYCSTSTKYYYEMPEKYQKSCYLANASFHDNINWFYHRGIEMAFSNFIWKFRKLSPSSKEEETIRNVINKINLMEKCSYIMEMHFPVMRDSGKVDIVTGFCAKHGLHYPRHLGGLRLSETTKKSQIKALAALTSFRHICADIPFAGSYSGLKIDPSTYSETELSRLISKFTEIIAEKNFFGNENDKDLACITGKSYQNGGLQNYYEYKADGLFFGVNAFLNQDLFIYKLKMKPGWRNKTYIIKCLDKVGINLVKRLIEAGAICVGISEDDFGYYNENGINIEEAIQYKLKHGSCRNYFPLYNEKKIMKEKCDVLIITDTYHKIDYNSAPDVEAKIIVEAANGIITPTAHRIFVGKEKLVLPDIFMNSGSSIASHIEYVKNIKCAEDSYERQAKNFLFLPKCDNVQEKLIEYDPDKEDERIDDDTNFLEHALEFQMDTSAQKIMKRVRDYNLHLDIRTAAYILATEKIFDLLHSGRFL